MILMAKMMEILNYGENSAWKFIENHSCKVAPTFFCD